MNTQRKGLNHKNQLYSIALALILLCFLVGYFIYMLPSLYVDYQMEQNLKAIKTQHTAYVENGSYREVKVANPATCISFRIPYEGDSVFLAGAFFQMEMTPKEAYAKTILAELQKLLSDYKDASSWKEEDNKRFSDRLEAALSHWKALIEAEETGFSLPVTVTSDLKDSAEYKSKYTKTHAVSDRCIILEAAATDNKNTYTSYFALEDIGDSFVFTIFSSVMPDMNEIRPVVLQSLPMICAVILLLVLVFSQVYSHGILTPLYAALEKQNEVLAEENKRQEIFMRASSHKLKTPLSAALLLLDGMINQVGKYRDTKKYLPRVKSQLLSMRKMVEDILSLNHYKEHMNFQSLNLITLLDRCLSTYRIVISDKKLFLSLPDKKELFLVTDEYLFTQILDNMISNAVKYTPVGEAIEIRITGRMLSIENHGVTIPEDILPHIFDPFVSGNHETTSAGHGLGLYIASYYAKQLHASLLVENHANSVLAAIVFDTKKDS